MQSKIIVPFFICQDDKRSVLESLRRATVELDYAKEREDRFSSDLEVKLLQMFLFVFKASPNQIYIK